MKAKQLVQMVVDNGGPALRFWENDLQIGCESVLVQVNKPGFMAEWIAHRTGRQIEVMRQNFGLNGDGSTRKKKSAFEPDDRRLLPYLLVQEFAKFKSKGATIQWAHHVLPETSYEMCRVNDDAFDALALCFAIYHHDHQQLQPILHLDRIYKSGFARMKLKGGPRKPKQPLSDYLTPAKVVRILNEFDEFKADGRASDFKNILLIDKRVLVFVRRCERPDAILQGTEVVHGYRPEWIVLEFMDAGKRVNISSVSVGDSLAIANRIVSAYYGKDCEYENEVDVTYAKQIDGLLAKLKGGLDPALQWVELVVSNTPLAGSCAMKLSDAQSRPIGKAVAHFERKVGRLVRRIENIESIKVSFCQKRVSLLFDGDEDTHQGYVVRYSDHRLTPAERRTFEAHMRTTYEIPVLSTEKRFKDQS